MCHHRGEIPDWTALEEPDESETEDELPEFLNEETGTETTVLTDGGDEA
jgi:hypothetical protein